MQRLVSIFYAICLLSCSLVTALAAPINFPASTNEISCNLPAPSDLIVTNVTTNSIAVQWNDVAGATGYAVEARNAVTQQVYAQFNVTTNSANCDGLPSGTPIIVEVAAICSGGAVSPNKASVVETTNFIIELVINGYAPCDPAGNAQSSNGNSQCGFSVVKDTDYAGTITDEVGITHKFIMRYVPRSGSKDPVLYVRPDNIGVVQYTVANSKARITFKKGGIAIAQMSYSAQYTNSDVAFVSVTNIKTGYNFNWDECGKPPGMSSGRSNDDAATVAADTGTDLIAVAPNPFTDVLHITPLNDDNTSLTLQLYDLKGTLIQNWTFDQENTANTDLFIPDLPQGMYLLRATTPQKVETHLLSKL